MGCQRSVCRTGRGFTLLEVLLTLCVLVMITSLAWPVLRGPIDSLRLRRAADEIHAQWASARVEAMDSGRTYMFRYALGGPQNQFRVEAYTPAECSTDSQQPENAAAATGGSGYAGTPAPTITGTLPPGVSFLAGQATADSRAAMVLATLANSSTLNPAEWSDPILFFPDGTTSDAILQLRNDRNRTITLSLRGLTGTVTIGEATTAVENSL